MNLISVIPNTICNDRFVVRDPEVLDMLRSIESTETFRNFEDSFWVQGRDPKLYQSCFLHVVTETVFDYPHNSFSEKTWKPIVNLRPFVMVSVPGALSELRNHGFKTFSDWWDEGYDDIMDPLTRMKSIVEVIRQVSEKSIDELKEIYEDMKPIVRFNYDHYYGLFRTQALKNFEKQCRQNLLAR
jgi:hypothetical protein